MCFIIFQSVQSFYRYYSIKFIILNYYLTFYWDSIPVKVFEILYKIYKYLHLFLNTLTVFDLKSGAIQQPGSHRDSFVWCGIQTHDPKRWLPWITYQRQRSPLPKRVRCKVQLSLSLSHSWFIGSFLVYSTTKTFYRDLYQIGQKVYWVNKLHGITFHFILKIIKRHF